MAYDIGDLPHDTLIGPLARATEALVRLDERLARSPVRDGFVERQNFAEAVAALWLEGELVHLEDLVLHDAQMDARAPTHELTRAHAVLRARRRILAHAPDWALTREGLRQLTGRGVAQSPGDRDEARSAPQPDEPPGATGQDVLAEELAAIDAVLERSARLLDGDYRPAQREQGSARDRPELIYDLDWDEDARLGEWLGLMKGAKSLPSLLRAALLLDAWQEIEVLQRGGWLGPLLVAALLRQDGVAAHHLAGLHLGARSIARERRRAADRGMRLVALLDAVHEAARAGLKEHDRLMLAKGQLERRLGNRRSSSKLPELVAMVLSRPLVSTGMIQDRLKVSKQGALNLVGELGLREMTGRGRFRAWGLV